MEIKRDRYLNKLISFMWDGQVKVITGIRRCGKSYLLRNLFRTYLLGEGVPADHILSFELDLTRDIRYRNPLELANRVREIVENQREQFYLFVDEIQMSDEVPNPYNPDGKKITFYDALNDLKSLSNLDIYVTGSNSRIALHLLEKHWNTRTNRTRHQHCQKQGNTDARGYRIGKGEGLSFDCKNIESDQYKGHQSQQTTVA